MNKQTAKLMLLGGNILAIIGCFLPFVSLFGFNVAYIEGDGKFVLILCAVSIVLAFIKAKFAIVANIIALIITLIGFFNAADFSFDVLGIGAYAIVIGNIIAMIGSEKARKA